MRALVASIIVLTAILTVAPAQGEDVYKWVDASGVTNYSSAPPADAKSESRSGIVPQRVSVYTPDAGAQRAAGAAHALADRVRDNRIERLEQTLLTERQARQYAAAADVRAAQAAYEYCLAQRRVDCAGYDDYPTYAPVIIAPVRRRLPAFVPTLPLTGVTAGNVTDAIRIGGGGVNQTPGAPGASFGVPRNVPAKHTGMRFSSQ